MKIVLDTNVIASGLLCPYSSSGKIIRLAISGNLQLCFDARILWEYRDVLFRPKFSFDPKDVYNLLAQIEVRGFVVASAPLYTKLPDTSDEPFLEVAISGDARYLITGNLKHYPKSRRYRVKVLSPMKFLEIYKKEM